MTIEFEVVGVPQPKGSTKAFMRPGMRYPVITCDNTKQKPWAQDVRLMAQNYAPPVLWIGPVRLDLTFFLLKPKSAPKRKPVAAIKKPDLDKLTRAVKDALKGVIYRDDSQVVEAHLFKLYGDRPGVRVKAKEVTLETIQTG